MKVLTSFVRIGAAESSCTALERAYAAWPMRSPQTSTGDVETGTFGGET